MRYEYEKHRDNLVHWIARHLPKRLVYWCAITLGAHATTGDYGHQLVPDLTFMDAIKRYGADYLGDGDGQCKYCLGDGCPACDARHL